MRLFWLCSFCIFICVTPGKKILEFLMKLLYILKEAVLSEVFDKPYDFNISKVDKSGYMGTVVYSFKDKNNNSYVAEFSSLYRSDKKDWLTSFDYKIENQKFAMSNLYDVQVLSTIASIFMDFVNKFQPPNVEYLGVKEEKESGEEGDPAFVSKRASVYKLLVGKFKKDLPDYKFSFKGSNGYITRETPRVEPKDSDSKELKDYYSFFSPPSNRFLKDTKSYLSDYDN